MDIELARQLLCAQMRTAPVGLCPTGAVDDSRESDRGDHEKIGPVLSSFGPEVGEEVVVDDGGHS